MKKKSLILIYFISGLTGAMPFLFAPIVAKELNVENFGLYNLFHSSVYFLLPVITIGYQTALRAKLSHNTDAFVSSIKKWITLIFGLGGLVILLFFILKAFDLIRIESNDFLVVLMATIPIAILSFLTVYWEVKEKFLVITTVKFLASVGIYSLLFLFLFQGASYYSRVYAQIIIYTLVCVVLFLLILRKSAKPRRSFDFGHKDLIKIGWPLTLISFLDLLLLNLDKWLILSLQGDYQLGLYSAYFYFYSGTVFLASPLGSIIETYIFKNNRESGRIRNLLYLMIFILVILCLVFSKTITLLLFGRDYTALSYLIAVFAMTAFFRIQISDRIRDLIHQGTQVGAFKIYLAGSVVFVAILYLSALNGGITLVSFSILAFNVFMYFGLTWYQRTQKGVTFKPFSALK